MSKRKKFLLVAAAGIFCLVALLAIGRKIFFITAPCGQPCESLGSRINPEDPDGYTHVPQCEPLKLSLSLSSKTLKAGEQFSLWYRLTLKNTSCERLTFDVRSFLFHGRQTNSKFDDYSFEILGPDGESIKDGSFDVYVSKFRPLYPYKTDHTASPKLMEAEQIGDNMFLTLQPGEEISTNPMTLDPHCMMLPEDRQIIERHGRRVERMIEDFCKKDLEEFKPPKPAPPPEGFRVLDETVFSKPGIYKIRARFNESISSQPIYPYAERFPQVLAVTLRLLGKVVGTPLFPNEFDWETYEFRPESNTVEFKVVKG